MGLEWGTTNAERRHGASLPRRSASTGVVPGATSQRGGFLSRCQAVLAGPSARELSQGRPASYSDALAALERIYRRIAA